MVVNTTWSAPNVAGGAGGTDLAGGDTLSETVWDRVQSNLYRLGGADGNSKTGQLKVGLASYAYSSTGLIVDQTTGVDDGFSLLGTGGVAHGMTTHTDTATYFSVIKVATGGGAYLLGYTNATTAVNLLGRYTTGNTTKSTGANAPVQIDAAKKTGTTTGAMGANENIACFRNNTTTTHIIDADGDSHQDVGTAWTNFSDHDDVGLLNILSAHVTRDTDPLKERFKDFLEERREELEELRLVTFNEDGHHFVNMSRLSMLLVGAAIQTGRRLGLVEQRLAGLLPSSPG